MIRRELIQNFMKKYKVRLVLCGVLITSLYVTPALTQAQYKWTLNGYNILQAAEFYFDGNYMHDVSENAYYQTTGWDGGDLTLPNIEIRNYSNALLANKKDENVYYTMDWSIKAFKADKTELVDSGYRLSVELSGSSDARIDGEIAKGKIIGDGNPKKQTYKMEIKALEEGKLSTGDYVEITLYAHNTDSNYTGNANSFQRELKCVFRYIVSTADSYVKNFDPTEKDGSREVRVLIGTGAIPGMDAQTQTVYLWWDMAAFEINPFNMTFSEMSSQTNHYWTEENNGTTYGILKITGLGSNANRTLDFYKQNYNGKTPTENWGLTDDNYLGKNKHPGEGGILGYYLENNSFGSGTQQ